MKASDETDRPPVIPTVQAAAGVAGPGMERAASVGAAEHSRVADYQELFKVRVTLMVVITAWAGFYLGSMRSGITSMQR